MMSMIIEQLSDHKEYAPRLTFEILEDKNIFDYNRVNEIFMYLKAYGSKIAIDDFGSGYANYSYLIKLNVDIIKIDGELIKELKIQPQKSTKVLKSIKKLAKELGYEVIAEFVSDEEIYNYMVEIGIEYSQGFYLGEPKFIQEYLD
jgi:EAL domain-containing protein (putative c-di-GMP-specific phosphodiesterase class I)